jgi:TonB family protein
MWKVFSILLAALAVVTIPSVAAPETAQSAKSATVVADTSDDKLPSDSWVKLDSVPEVISQVQPAYPEKDKEAGITGKYWVKMLINKQGLVRQATILKAEGGSDGLAESALAAARQWRFRPGFIQGKPEACWVTTAVIFKLAPKSDSAKAETPKTK